MTVPTWSDDAKSAAGKLLNASPSRPEDNIRQDIVRLLIALGIEEFTLTYRTSAGEADIYMQRRRVFFETKKVGLADHPHRPQARKTSESPFGQLKRYLEAEMKDELGRLPLGKQPTLAWTGIVTDGRVWHAWRFPHAPGSTPTNILDGFRPRNENELLCKIEPLLNATPVGKPWIPADPVPVFDGRLETLREIHAGMSGRVLQTTETKMLLWLDMLRGSGMAPNSTNAQARLFTAHCFLVALARGVVHTLLNPDIKPDSKKLLGNGYPAWILSVENGRKWAQELLETVHGYEWRRRAGDVLRPLYERFVDSSDRHSFGEVYTPDWLAEMMVEEVLDGKWCDQAVLAALADLRGLGKLDGIGVLDPTCGSGTFLYHCARRILANPKVAALQAVQQADVVCRLVHGIDIHPVAIEFCKATILRALPAPPTAGDLAPAIYQGDSLMLRQTEKETLFDPRDGEIVIRSPGGIQIVIPRAFSENMEFSDMMRRMVDAAAEGSELPEDIGVVMGNDKEKIEECHRALMDVIRAEGNSVWTWYITNVLGPDRLSRQKVNRVVANPPWVKMSNIQVPDRKRGLERLAGKETTMGSLDLWVGGTQAPHLDIAQLFVRRTRETYLKKPLADPAAWVLKVSAIRAGNWEKFRNWHHKYLAHALDLTNVKVFGSGDARRSCVLFEKRRSSIRAEGDGGDAVELLAECPKAVPEASMPWSRARKLIDWKKPKVYPKKPSHYSEDGWRVGATVLPRVLTMVDREKLEFGGGGGRIRKKSDDCAVRQIPMERTSAKNWQCPIALADTAVDIQSVAPVPHCTLRAGYGHCPPGQGRGFAFDEKGSANRILGRTRRLISRA